MARPKGSKNKNRICPKGHNKDIVGSYPDGHCKLCIKIYREKYRKQNKHKIKMKKKLDYEKNRIEILRKRKKDYIINKEKIAQRRKQLYEKNRDTILAQNRRYRRKNKKEISKRQLEKIHSNVDCKLRIYLRSRLNKAIKRDSKKGSAVRDLGCTIAFFKTYIENMFYGDMSWDNWGTYWELDHIEELHTFDLTNRKQFLKAVNYKNMQPLTIPDHLKKTAKNRKVNR